MRTRFLRMVVLVTPMVSANTVLGFDFDCDGARTLVRTLALGPDRIVNRITRDPERFVKRLVPGWICVTDPMPPIKNNRNFLKGIECIQSNERVPVSVDDIADSGRRYQRNLKNVLGCFPKNISSSPVTYGDTTRGEGLLVALDQYVSSGRGNRHHILVEYTYFQDRESPIYWRMAAKIGSPRSAQVGRDPALCRKLERIERARSNYFRNIRGRYDRDFEEYKARIKLPDAWSCSISSDREEAEYYCVWRIVDNDAEGSRIFEEVTNGVTSCLANKIRRTRSRESKGRVFRTMYLRDDKGRVRVTKSKRVRRRTGENITSIRLYVEQDKY